MATPDGASGNDPVLDAALAEMESEGALETSESTDASQGADSASAEIATPSATGDDGKGVAAVPDPATPPAEDPLAGTEPFTYGEGKTLEGVYRVPGEGLLVPEDKVASITQLAERADTLDRVSRESATLNATYERLSEWKTTGEDGKETSVKGLEGLAAMRTSFSTLKAAFDTFTGIFKDPAKFAGLVDVSVDEGGKIVIAPNQTALGHLLTESDLAEARATAQTHQQLRTMAAPPAPAPGAPDYSKHAPAVITQAAAALDEHLTAEDRATLSAQLPRYVRTVTEEDRRLNPSLTVGGPIVDAAFTQVVQHLATAREASKKTAVAHEKAGKFNAGQEKGRQPGKKPVAPTPPKKGEPPKKVSRSEQWDAPLAQALEEMGVAR